MQSSAAVTSGATTAAPAAAGPAPAPKLRGPFAAGDFVEIRGWRGRLEAAGNPFGPSGRERRVLRDADGIEYWHDPATDLLYATPVFSRDSLDASYQAPNAHVDTRGFARFDRAAWEERADRSYVVSRIKVDLVRRWMPAGGRLIDVGCHMGLFVLLAREAGFAAEGIDVSADAICVGREEVGVPTLRAATIETAGYPPACMDGVIVWDVLEHVHNLVEVMDHCARILRPGGHFFAQVPNHRGASAQIKTLLCRLGLRGRRYHHFGFPWHLYHFSPRSLDHLVRRSGLAPVRIASFSHRSKEGRGAGWLNRRIEALALADYVYVVARKPGR
jgi:SAM-dependent methyltransferase